MRRLAVLSLAPVATLVIALSGCDSGTPGTPAAGATSPAGVPVSASPSADPTVAASASAATANTRLVCGTINQAIAQGSAAFGADLGTIAGHAAGGNTAGVAKAKTDALGHLTKLAGQIRTSAQLAEDPVVKAAAEDTAGKITALAADPTLLAGVRSTADIAPVIEKLTRASDSMNTVCI